MNHFRDLQDIFITNITSITLRSVAGKGDQTEMTLTTRKGDVVLRLIPWSVVKPLRVIDLRQRDKAKERKRRGDVPMSPEAIEVFLKK